MGIEILRGRGREGVKRSSSGARRGMAGNMRPRMRIKKAPRWHRIKGKRGTGCV